MRKKYNIENRHMGPIPFEVNGHWYIQRGMKVTRIKHE